MTWHFPIYTPVFIINIALSLWLSVMVWRHGKVPGAHVFAIMLLASGFWSFGHLLEVGIDQVWAQISLSKIEYLGAVVVGPGWFIFTCCYRRPSKRFPIRYAALLAIAPIITVLLAWTNESHHLIWTSITPSPDDPSRLTYAHGIWFYLAIIYNHSLVLAGTWNVYQVLRVAPKEQQSRSKALLIGALIPTLGSLLYVVGLSPLVGEDLTPVFLTITGIIYLLTVLRFRLFDVRRVARAAIIDNMRDGMLIIDEKNRLVDVNPSALQLLDVSRTIIDQDINFSLGQYPLILEIIQHPQTQPVTVALGDQPSRHLDLQVSELRDTLGKRGGKLVILRDVTERVTAEKAAFETAIEQHRHQLLTQFIRDISHEFRTPLSVINTSIYLMEKSADPVQHKTRRDLIQLQSRRLELLISEMLIAVQLDSNASLDRTRVNLNTLLQTVTHEQESTFAAKQQQLSLHLPEEALFILGDALMLQKALTNILQNASRYTPDSGTISVTGRRDHDLATIAISDSGIGMSAETQTHIFERFFRADDAHSTPGFGLGLPIAQTIIEKHHGHIDVESTLGTGSTFTICIPESATKAAAVPILQLTAL
jgi:signal transduction histidine kinase